MHRACPPLVAALLLAGCTAVDPQSTSSLRPGSEPGLWIFTATAPPALPANSAAAERTRMDWVSTAMTNAHACPGAWKVTSRRVFRQRVVMNAQTDRIVYEVACLGTT